MSNSTFKPELWFEAVKKVEPRTCIELRSLALCISDKGSKKESPGTKKQTLAELMVDLRTALSAARKVSELKDFWPEDNASPDDLLDWVKGLADFTVLPSVKAQTFPAAEFRDLLDHTRIDPADSYARLARKLNRTLSDMEVRGELARIISISSEGGKTISVLYYLQGGSSAKKNFTLEEVRHFKNTV